VVADGDTEKVVDGPATSVVVETNVVSEEQIVDEPEKSVTA
jgi:hypothetical protein